MANLSKRSVFYKLYLLVFGAEPNDNFCDYFWGLVIALLMMPLSFPVFLVVFLYARWFSDKLTYDRDILDYRPRTLNERIESSSLKFSGNVYATLVLILFTMMNIIMYKENFMGTAYLAFGIAIATIVGIAYIGSAISDSEKVGDFVDSACDFKDIVSTRWKSFKGKYCPKINWKE